MKQIRTVLFCVVLPALVACAADPQAKGNLYTYVDAQGNLVTVQKSAEKQAQEQAQEQAQKRKESTGPDGEQYQSDEQVQAGLEARDRNRFITYPGPDGQLVKERLDLVAEREQAASEAPGYDQLADAPEFVERMLGVRADCCAHTLDQATALEQGEEVLIAIAGSEQTLLLEQPTPGRTLKLSAGVATLRLRGYVDKGGNYLAPGMVFMDADGVPVLVVDRPYQRRFPETWYRFAFFEGTVEVPPEAAYAAFYLPYAAREGDTGVRTLPDVQTTYETSPALTGELTVFAAPTR